MEVEELAEEGKRHRIYVIIIRRQRFVFSYISKYDNLKVNYHRLPKGESAVISAPPSLPLLDAPRGAPIRAAFGAEIAPHSESVETTRRAVLAHEGRQRTVVAFPHLLASAYHRYHARVRRTSCSLFAL